MILTILEELLPLLGAILKTVLTNPARYASLKDALTRINADITSILAGMP